MTHEDTQLLAFARRTLAILERDEEWDATTTDDIAADALERGLGDTEGPYDRFRNLTDQQPATTAHTT